MDLRRAPSPRLLWLVAWVGLPGALGIPWFPELEGLLALALGALLCIALIDRWLPQPGLGGLKVKPGVLLRMARGRPSALSLTLQRPSQSPPLLLRCGLELPGAFEAEPATVLGRFSGAAEGLVLRWTLNSSRRGRFVLGPLQVEVPSALRLWRLRRTLDCGAEAQVAPSLGRERKAMAHFLLRQGPGVRSLRVSGQGREFDKLRETSPGDAFSDIDWKATARKGKPVSRVYQVERTQELLVAIDASRLSARPVPGGGPGDDLLESHLRAALALQMAASAQGDRFGIVAFGGRVLGQAWHKGSAGSPAVTRLLSQLRSNNDSPDYHELARVLGGRSRKKRLLVLLACLDDPLAGEQCLQVMPQLTRRHAVLALSARNHGAEPAFGRALGPGEDLADALAAQWRYQGLRRLSVGLRAVGAQLSWVAEERLAYQAVQQYLRARERQWV